MVTDKTVKCESEGGKGREKGLFMGDESRKKREAFKCVSPRCLFTALLLETDSFKSLWGWEKKIKQQSHKMLHS